MAAGSRDGSVVGRVGGCGSLAGVGESARSRWGRRQRGRYARFGSAAPFPPGGRRCGGRLAEPVLSLHRWQGDMAAGGFETVCDPDWVVVAVDELRVVHGLLLQRGDLMAEMPGVAVEWAAGMKAAAALVAQRMRHAEARLSELTAGLVRAGVVVVDPERGLWADVPHGQSVLPVVSASRVDGVVGVSSGVSRLAAGERSRARVHRDVDVIMVVVFGAAVVTWWDRSGVVRRVVCRRHQHVHVPRGTPYAVGNPGAVPMVAVLAHSGSDVTGGAELMSEFDRDAAVDGQDWPGAAGAG